ncbi:MAG: hypothetical protein EBU85_05095 [Actinobacteria bacterium]|nr:hypothetical protein [Actinomycetota bacterium]
MKRWIAVLAAMLIGATAAAPAFADEGQPSDPVCFKVSGEDYTQVVCQDAEGNQISVTTYFNDGCITTQDESGESSTCKNDEQELDGTGEYFPNDIACDVEVLSDADGVEYKFVTCRNVDGTLAWQARYTADGCVTQIDADGSEFTSCPEVQPWLPPTTDISCDTEPWADDNGVEYKLVTCRDSAGNVVSKTRYAQDGCVTQIDADGGEFTSCPEVQPELPPTTELSCDSEPWADDSGVEYKLVTCRDADGNVVSKTRYAQDGCVTQIDTDGSESTTCPSPECIIKVEPDAAADGEWTQTVCTLPTLRAMFDGVYAAGDVERGGTIVYTAFGALSDVGSTDADVAALASATARSGSDESSANTAIVDVEPAASAEAETQPTAVTLVAAPATASDSGTTSPVSPATAALAFAGVGAACFATNRVRLRLRRR